MKPRCSVHLLLLGFAIATSACSPSDSSVSNTGSEDGIAGNINEQARAGSGGGAGTLGSGGAGIGAASAGFVGSGGVVGNGQAGGGDSASGGTSRRGGSGGTVSRPEGGTASGGSTIRYGSGGANGGSSRPGEGATGGASDGGGGSRRGEGGMGGADGGSTTDAGGSVPSTSTGCGKTPKLKSSNATGNFTPNTVTVSGKSRQFVIRWPTNYDNKTPYRLILDLHGYGGSYSETGRDYFGLWSLSKDTTIFVALSAEGGDWRTGDNSAYVDEVLTAVEADLCIDTSRIMLEGFSQGAAMAWTLACGRPGVFRAAVGHSGGGVTNPKNCQPIPYFGSGGLQESVTQTTQTDQFAKWNGCTTETFSKPPTGGHVCSDYKGCSADHPVRWCAFDGPHTPSPSDSGKSTSWMPSEVWTFLSQF